MRDLYIVIFKESNHDNSPIRWTVVDTNKFDFDTTLKLAKEFETTELYKFDLRTYYELSSKHELMVNNYIDLYSVSRLRAIEYIDFINYIQLEVIKKQIELDNDIKSLSDDEEW